MALAEDVNSDGQLTLGEVKQTSQQEMTLALQGKAQPVTQEVVVHYSANVSIKAAHWAAPNNTRKIQVDDQKKQIQIELNQQALADTLVLTLNPTATEDVTFSYGQQQRALTLNTGTDPTESTAITSSQPHQRMKVQQKKHLQTPLFLVRPKKLSPARQKR